MSLRFELAPVSTQDGVRHALVIVPTAHVRLGLSDLESLCQAYSGPSPRDQAIIDAAREHPEASFSIFRGQAPDGSGSYGFDERMSVEERNEVAYCLLRHQLQVYKEFMRCGICLHVHSDWGVEATDAFDSARWRLLGEYKSGAPGCVEELDAWLLRNLVFFFRVRFEALVGRILPDKLPMMESRMRTGSAMVLGRSMDRVG